MATFRSDRKPYSRPAARPRASDGAWLHDKAPGFNKADLPTIVKKAPAPTGNTKLVVSNLHYELTPKDLTQIFGQHGTLVREPLIRYDRSGRSEGVAFISYETAAEATTAKREFDGKLAKGQPMQIEFDAGPPPRAQARRVASAPSLINRIQKQPLLDRLGQGPKAKVTAPVPTGPGPVRSRARPPRAPKRPKTAQELDSELDAFMKDDASAAPAPPSGDVEMTS